MNQHQVLSSIQIKRARVLALNCGYLWSEIVPFDLIPKWSPALIAAYVAMVTGDCEPLVVEDDKIVGVELETGWRWSVDRQGNIDIAVLTANNQWKSVEDLSKLPNEVFVKVTEALNVEIKAYLCT